MSDYDLLLRGVLIDPAADLPRLVLADWLEETGTDDNMARAEFIRVQCSLAVGKIAVAEYARRSWASQLGNTPRHVHDYGCLLTRERKLFAELAGGGLPDAGLPAGCVTTIDAINGELSPREPLGFPLAFVRRGFVDEVRLPLADFLSVPCRRCYEFGGRRVIDNPVRRRRSSAIVICPSCQGTGVTPGHAAALFAAQPLTAVTVTAVEPEEVRDGERSGLNRLPLDGVDDLGAVGEWYYRRWPDELPQYLAPAPANGHNLPSSLFELLPGPKLCGRATHLAFYPSKSAALVALSEACVAYGREAAGLTRPAEVGAA